MAIPAYVDISVTPVTGIVGWGSQQWQGQLLFFKQMLANVSKENVKPSRGKLGI